MFTNPYAGLVVFIAVPAVFVLGLLLIPVGHVAGATTTAARSERRRANGRSSISVSRASAEQCCLIGAHRRQHRHRPARRLWRAARMETPAFCGQACHTPMHPQFTAWQAAPHSGVACATCHIGEGAQALVHAKLAGVRQLVSRRDRPVSATDSAGVADMRPARETCGNCHWPGRAIRRSSSASCASTPTTKPTPETDDGAADARGRAGQPTSRGRAIHWHADPARSHRVRATDAERQTIPYVRVTDEKGKVKEYVAEGRNREAIAAGERRDDGLHRLPQRRGASHLADRRAGRRSRPSPPHGQPRTAVCPARKCPAREGDYPSQERGWRKSRRDCGASITAERRRRRGGRTDVGAVQELYRRNVFPVMKVTCGSYPEQPGHITSNGCFRCHDGRAAKDGSKISGDCESCHKQIETPIPAPTSPK